MTPSRTAIASSPATKRLRFTTRTDSRSNSTREIAAERGAVVDTVAFDRLMDEQRERARRDAAAKRELVELAELPAVRSEFTGYDEGLEADGRVVAVLKDGSTVQSLAEGEEGILILDRTSFYAERGGQIGDRGTILRASADRRRMRPSK